MVDEGLTMQSGITQGANILKHVQNKVIANSSYNTYEEEKKESGQA